MKGQEKLKSQTKYPRIARNSEPKPQETMISWFERQASSHHAQLAAAVVLSGVTVAALIYGTQAIRRKEAVQELKASIPELDETHHADMVRLDFTIRTNGIYAHRLSEAHRFWCCLATTEGQQRGRKSICSRSSCPAR